VDVQIIQTENTLKSCHNLCVQFTPYLSVSQSINLHLKMVLFHIAAVGWISPWTIGIKITNY